MPRHVKEEEKVEMIIRGLLKQPDNRRCINCNSLGPQYVCTTFWTFVCTNCSRVHREFTHCVKSVSMAKFSDEEIMSLQAGGNERAKQIYLKNWDPHHNSYPNTRKYAGESSSSKQPVAQSESRNSFCDWPSERSRWGKRDDYLARSPVERGSSSCKDEFYDHSLFERSSSAKGLNLKDFLEERSPRNNQVMPRSSSHRSRSTRFEIVDDRFRDDGSVKRYERSSGSGGRSPSSLKSVASLPVITPTSAFLGDQTPELRVAEPPAADDHKTAEGSTTGQNVADTDAEEKENEAKNSTSLINFLDEKPEANEQMAANTNNESRCIFPINSVEALLFELSAPMASSSAVATAPAQSNSADATDVEATEAPEISDCCEALAVTVMPSDQQLNRDNANHMMQDVFRTHDLPPSYISNTLQSASSVESSLNEQGNRSPASDYLRRTRSVPLVQSLEVANPSPSARKEIPEDLFSSGFASFAPPVSGWQMHPLHRGMPFYPPSMPVVAYQNPTRPKNPFDIDDDDRYQAQAATFLSMSPFHGAYPNTSISAASQPQPSPYLSSQSYRSSYGMNMPLVPGAYMAQLSNNMLLTRPEGNANFGRSEDAFASLNPITRGSGAAAPNSPLPRAGNPFG